MHDEGPFYTEILLAQMMKLLLLLSFYGIQTYTEILGRNLHAILMDFQEKTQKGWYDIGYKNHLAPLLCAFIHSLEENTILRIEGGFSSLSIRFGENLFSFLQARDSSPCAKHNKTVSQTVFFN